MADIGEIWKVCECQKKKRILHLAKASQITEEFQKLGFQNFELKDKPKIICDAYKCAIDYLKNFESIKNDRKNSIALLGRPGAGKTHLLTAICNNLILKGIAVQYMPWVETFNELRDDFGLLNERIIQMQKVPVLYIDDLFKSRKKPTDFQIEQLYAIVNYRYLNNLPLLISSEIDMDSIADIDEATGTRIYQMCKDYTVLLSSDDRSLNHRLVD